MHLEGDKRLNLQLRLDFSSAPTGEARQARGDAAKLITRALSSGDFIVTPDFGSLSHLKYFYDRPKSLHVVDIAVMTLDHGTIASTDIRLRLMPSDN